MNDSDRDLREFIKENSRLFWWIDPEKIENIELPFLVEAVLNYGNEKSVKKLFELVGIKTVADIFDRQISGGRTNYHPRTINFFKLYFERHA